MGAYLDVLDPVRFNRKRYIPDEISENLALADVNFKVQVLLGKDTPLLTQTQAFDSRVFLNALADSRERKAILELIQNNRITIALLQNIPTLKQALITALENPSYVFSGLRILSEGSMKEQEDKRRQCILLLEGNPTRLDFDQDGFVTLVLEGIIQVSEVLKNRFSLIQPPVYSVEMLLEKSLHTVKDFDNKPEWTALQEVYLCAAAEKQASTRSFYYQYLHNLYHPDIANRACYMLDTFYNLSVGSSVTGTMPAYLTGSLSLFHRQFYADLGNALQENFNPLEQKFLEADSINPFSWQDVAEVSYNITIPAHLGAEAKQQEKARQTFEYCNQQIKGKIVPMMSGLSIPFILVNTILNLSPIAVTIPSALLNIGNSLYQWYDWDKKQKNNPYETIRKMAAYHLQP